MFDVLLRGGRVFDGTGAPPVCSDVGIRGDRVAEIGDLAAASARETADVAGHFVCPGFIDTHSHSDVFCLVDPAAPSKLLQGVTTEVVGQCGISAAPRHGEARWPPDWERLSGPPAWRTVAEYREIVDRARPPANLVLLIGHNLLRGGVLGYSARKAAPEEIRLMARRLDRALEEGGWGLSTGLAYPPGRYAPPDEIQALARVTASRGGIYATHIRSERDALIPALREAIDTGRAAGLPVLVSHLKAGGRGPESKRAEVIERIEAARRDGLAVFADRYPYLAGCTDLDILLPGWAVEGARARILGRIAAPGARARIRESIESEHPEGFERDIRIGSTRRAEFLGRSLADVAAALGVRPAEAVLRLLEEDRLATGAVFFGMSESDLRAILEQPWVCIGSDASLRSPEGALRFDHPHPRAYGTFPRLLRQAVDGKSVPPAEMIRKMTSLPAALFGLRGRGRLEPGAFADVTVLDPGRIRDRATYESPHALPEGVAAVLVNGVAEVWDGRPTGRRGGRFLARAE